ncbi:hypothetical protein [Nocardioides psychrotolerans]|uniref:Uncharacterized protein n=1 Tax=Nocardioides psychrotolerans TaxID=1005945 RepID=A0A1I3EU87_9ACTN|nr:hypothetical protein [Nocardioides psychrotolerans]SFI02440.1 hypothetical protein SAMN05216561_10467 [Nocardioides psychrotolerans]
MLGAQADGYATEVALDPEGAVGAGRAAPRVSWGHPGGTSAVRYGGDLQSMRRAVSEHWPAVLSDRRGPRADPPAGFTPYAAADR